MSTANHARYLHRMLDLLAAGKTIGDSDFDMLRKALPERPEQKTLKELQKEVYAAWLGAGGNIWDYDGHVLETWLDELYTQLKGLETTTPAHPEFLETEADYAAAPEGTIVASSGRFPWVKGAASGWACSSSANSDFAMSKIGRRNVLRWGWGE